MAKNNYYNKGNTKRGGTASTRRDNAFVWKIVSLVLAIILMAFTVLAVFELVTPYKPSRGFKPQVQVPATPNEGGEGNNKPTGTATGGTILNEAKGNGIRMMNEVIEREAYEDYGIDTHAESAYTIMATIEPADATFRTMTWSAKWQNETSEWATGKSVDEYVTLTPGVSNAQAVFSQAFGEPIEITVALEYDEEMYATILCDYLSAVERVELKVGCESAGQASYVEDINGVLPIFLNYTGDAQKHRYAFILGDATYGVGTVRGTVKYTKYVLLQHSSAFMVQLERKFATTTSGLTLRSDANTQNVMMTVSFGDFKRFDKLYLQGLLATYFDGTLEYSEDMFKQFMYQVCASNTGKPHGEVRVSYQYTYEGKTYASAYTESRNFNYDATDLGVAPTGVTADKTHIVVS